MSFHLPLAHPSYANLADFDFAAAKAGGENTAKAIYINKETGKKWMIGPLHYEPFLAYKLYNAYLGPYSAQVKIITADGQHHLGVEFIDGFVSINQAISDFFNKDESCVPNGCTSNNQQITDIDRQTPSTIDGLPLQGGEELFAFMLLLGENGGHDDNVGLVLTPNDGYHYTKVDEDHTFHQLFDTALINLIRTTKPWGVPNFSLEKLAQAFQRIMDINDDDLANYCRVVTQEYNYLTQRNNDYRPILDLILARKAQIPSYMASIRMESAVAAGDPQALTDLITKHHLDINQHFASFAMKETGTPLYLAYLFDKLELFQFIITAQHPSRETIDNMITMLVQPLSARPREAVNEWRSRMNSMPQKNSVYFGVLTQHQLIDANNTQHLAQAIKFVSSNGRHLTEIIDWFLANRTIKNIADDYQIALACVWRKRNKLLHDILVSYADKSPFFTEELLQTAISCRNTEVIKLWLVNRCTPEERLARFMAFDLRHFSIEGRVSEQINYAVTLFESLHDEHVQQAFARILPLLSRADLGGPFLIGYYLEERFLPKIKDANILISILTRMHQTLQRANRNGVREEYDGAQLLKAWEDNLGRRRNVITQIIDILPSLRPEQTQKIFTILVDIGVRYPQWTFVDAFVQKTGLSKAACSELISIAATTLNRARECARLAQTCFGRTEAIDDELEAYLRDTADAEWSHSCQLLPEEGLAEVTYRPLPFLTKTYRATPSGKITSTHYDISGVPIPNFVGNYIEYFGPRQYRRPTWSNRYGRPN